VEADLQVFEGKSRETFTEIARFFDRHLGK
jgi:hypothetical protein